MLHVTFEDRTTALFDPCESVIVADDISVNEHNFYGVLEGLAHEVLKAGQFVLYRDYNYDIFHFDFVPKPHADLRPSLARMADAGGGSGD